jgi:uncharacterized protein (TIGR03000 family)
MSCKASSVCGGFMLGAALLLAAPTIAHAQRGGRGGMGSLGGMSNAGMMLGGNNGGMMHGGMSFGGNHFPGSFGIYGGGFRSQYWWYMHNQFPYSGGMYASPYIGGYRTYNMSPYSGNGGYSAPSYGGSTGLPTPVTINNYPPTSTRARAETATDRAHVTIQLPPDGEVTIQGTRLNATGPIRHFDSPPLTAGTEYAYDVEATWKENGQEIKQSQRIDIAPGARTEVIFRTGAKPKVMASMMPVPTTP